MNVKCKFLNYYFIIYLLMDSESNIKSFDNTLNINEDILKGIENMLKYQNYQLMELLKKELKET